MNQKVFANTALVVVIIAIIAVGGYFIFVKKSGPITRQPTPINETVSWKTYRNDKYGFEFKYPPNSTIEPQQDLNYQYIRLQNYSSTDDRMSLADGEYYLEIFIFDNSLGHKSSQSCQQSVVNPKKVELGIVTGYRGYGEEGGDAGGIRFALCAERSEVYFYIQGTENNEKAPLVNPIFDSFRFIH